MSKLGRAISLAGAAAAGYVQGDKMRKRDEEDKVDREIRLAGAAYTQRQRARAESLDRDLATAARPIEVEEGAGGMIRPETMDNRDVGGADTAGMPNGGLSLGAARVGGQTFATAPEAQTAAAAQNTPEAVTLRQAGAYRAAGKPVEAMQLSNGVTAQKRTAALTADEERARARRYQEEGLFDVAKAARTGNAQAIFDAANAGGQFKLVGVPTVAEVERELPGVGKIKTFDVMGQVLGRDGKPQDIKINSHDLSMNLMPYEKALELQRKATTSDGQHQVRLQQLDLAAQKLELAGKVAEAKALRTAASGDGKIGREERLRFTSLLGDAGRRLGEARKALGKLQGDVLFMTQARKPGSPQAAELAELQASIQDHSQERDLFQSLLAGSQGGGKAPGLADAKPSAAPAPGQPVKVGSKAERDKLPKGAHYVGPDGQTYIKQ